MPSVKKTTEKEKQQKGSLRRKQKGGIIIFPLDTDNNIPTISCSKDNANNGILQVNETNITDSISLDTIPCEKAIFLYKKLDTKKKTDNYNYAYYLGFEEFESFWNTEKDTLVQENKDKEVDHKHFIFVFDVDYLIKGIEVNIETQKKHNTSEEPIIPTNPITRDKLEGIIEFLKSKQKLLDLKLDTIIDTHTNLLDAVVRGHLQAVKRLLAAGADVNEKNIYGLTALVYAASRGYLPIVAELLRAGATDERLSYNTILSIRLATRLGVKLQQTSALEEAAKHGHTEIVRELLTTYYQSLQQNSPIHKNKEVALMDAVEQNHLPIVKLLVEKGTDINTNKGFPLQQATANALYDIVVYLISKGVDIHIQKEAALRLAIEGVHENIKLAEWNKKRNNPYATYEKEATEHLEIVKVLLLFGADVHRVKIPKPIPENSIHKQLLTILQTAKEQQPKPPTLVSRVTTATKRFLTRSTQVVPLPQDGGARITYQDKSYKLRTEKDTGKKYITVGKEKTRVYVRTSKKGTVSFHKA